MQTQLTVTLAAQIITAAIPQVSLPRMPYL
jgi:hypothetical protein